MSHHYSYTGKFVQLLEKSYVSSKAVSHSLSLQGTQKTDKVITQVLLAIHAPSTWNVIFPY